MDAKVKYQCISLVIPAVQRYHFYTSISSIPHFQNEFPPGHSAFPSIIKCITVMRIVYHPGTFMHFQVIKPGKGHITCSNVYIFDFRMKTQSSLTNLHLQQKLQGQKGQKGWQKRPQRSKSLSQLAFPVKNRVYQLYLMKQTSLWRLYQVIMV